MGRAGVRPRLSVALVGIVAGGLLMLAALAVGAWLVRACSVDSGHLTFREPEARDYKEIVSAAGAACVVGLFAGDALYRVGRRRLHRWWVDPTRLHALLRWQRHSQGRGALIVVLVIALGSLAGAVSLIRAGGFASHPVWVSVLLAIGIYEVRVTFRAVPMLRSRRALSDAQQSRIGAVDAGNPRNPAHLGTTGVCDVEPDPCGFYVSGTRDLAACPRPRPVSATENVLGGAPLEIVYLRMFSSPQRVRTYLESAWRELGRVSFIQDSSAWRGRRSQAAPAVLSSVSTVEIEYLTQPGAVERRRTVQFDHVVGRRLKVKDKYRSYSVFSPVCHETVWKDAVDVLLRGADLVTIDLSGVTAQNAGTMYEVQRLFDTVPIERVLFLVDYFSDLWSLLDALRERWRRMDKMSPNRRPGLCVRIVVTDRVRVGAAGMVGWSFADREATRRLGHAWRSGALQGRQIG